MTSALKMFSLKPHTVGIESGCRGPVWKNAKNAGLDIITWSLERSGVMALDKGGWYYQSVTDGIHHEGDILEALHVLNKDVGIRGIFSDWPATVTFYANCMGLKWKHFQSACHNLLFFLFHYWYLSLPCWCSCCFGRRSSFLSTAAVWKKCESTWRLYPRVLFCIFWKMFFYGIKIFLFRYKALVCSVAIAV